MSTLMLNTIIKYKDSNTLFRIIWLDGSTKQCNIIELKVDILNIVETKIADLQLGLENGDIEIIKEEPSSLIVAYFGGNNKNANKMNKAFEFVQTIASPLDEPMCFEKHSRREMILSNIKEFKISEKTAYTYLRKYWQGGKTKASLYPRYYNCGGKGQNTTKNKKKVGPKSQSHKDGKCGPGIIITKDIIDQISYSIEKVYKDKSKATIKETYDWFLNQYFSHDVYTDGKLIKLIKDPDEIPTFGQFKYRFYQIKLKNLDQITISRDSQKSFDLNDKALESDSTYEVMGPNHKYQIDSTIADIYLLNSINGIKIPERPTVYIAVDVFSRLIAGIHVCFESPSIEGVASLLYNCAEDKYEYCSKYGIKIEKSDWPSYGLPRIIIADRGETAGPITEFAIRGLGMEFEQTPSYRGDAKGIVEQNFRILKNLTHRTLPGTIDKKFRERGDPDYRLDAKLTLAEYTKILIEAVIHRNNSILEDYPLNSAMIKDTILQIPSAIYNWGISEAMGFPIEHEEDVIKAALLRRGQALVESEGIIFKEGIYTCEIARSESWFSRARQTGTWKIEVIYDTRNNYNIFFFDKRTNKLETCYLNDKKTKNNRYLESFYIDDNQLYLGTSFYEIEKYQNIILSSKYENTKYKNQKQLELNESIKAIVDVAKKRKRLGSKDLKNIRFKRKVVNQFNKIEQSLANKKSEKDAFNEAKHSKPNENSSNKTRGSMINKIEQWEKED